MGRASGTHNQASNALVFLSGDDFGIELESLDNRSPPDGARKLVSAGL